MSEKKKILFIAKNIPIPKRQQGNKIIYTIAEKLSAHYDVSLFFPKSIVPFGLHLHPKHKPLYKLKDWSFGKLEVDVIPYIQLPGLFCTYWLFNKLPKRATHIFKEQEYNLIHAHYGMPDGYLAYLISKRFNIPYVLTIRSHDLRHLQLLHKYNFDFLKYKKVLTEASKICVLNSNAQKTLSNFGFTSEILPHGIDKSPETNRLPKQDEIIRIACVSQYLKRKNIEWVIDSFLSYKGKRKIELTIVGNMTNMPNIYKDKCAIENINLMRKVPNHIVLDILEKSDIFVLPSILETFGLVYIEAASKNNAIIGHVNEGVCGVFDNEKEMLFARDYEDFNTKLTFLIENDDFRKTLAEQALIKSNSLTWDKITERYQAIYENCL